jgi:hypothetical protein
MATLAIERVRWYAGVMAYLLVADLNTITESALQYLQAFGLGRELCVCDARGQRD